MSLARRSESFPKLPSQGHEGVPSVYYRARSRTASHPCRLYSTPKSCKNWFIPGDVFAKKGMTQTMRKRQKLETQEETTNTTGPCLAPFPCAITECVRGHAEVGHVGVSCLNERR
ncbi:unnamed protein product, partial [Ectocarpus sp. 8 AP-2014]